LVEDTFAAAALQATLGDGEAEAIVLTQELDASWVLLDDDLARVHATGLGLPVKGTAGILLAAHHAGLITDLKDILDAVCRGRCGYELFQHSLILPGDFFDCAGQIGP
jgi:predicted nucleic acid-binding protein